MWFFKEIYRMIKLKYIALSCRESTKLLQWWPFFSWTDVIPVDIAQQFICYYIYTLGAKREKLVELWIVNVCVTHTNFLIEPKKST